MNRTKKTRTVGAHTSFRELDSTELHLVEGGFIGAFVAFGFAALNNYATKKVWDSYSDPYIPIEPLP